MVESTRRESVALAAFQKRESSRLLSGGKNGSGSELGFMEESKQPVFGEGYSPNRRQATPMVERDDSLSRNSGVLGMLTATRMSEQIAESTLSPYY